jgi:hypothetical protein
MAVLGATEQKGADYNTTKATHKHKNPYLAINSKTKCDQEWSVTIACPSKYERLWCRDI